MGRSDRLPQKGRTSKYSLILLSFLVVAFMLIPNASALEFDNVHSYNEETKIVTITNAFGLGDVIGQARLTMGDIEVPRGYQQVAQFDIWAFQDYNNALKQFTFTDIKSKEKVNRNYDLKMLTYQDVEVQDYYLDNCYEDETELTFCDRIENGTHKEQKEVWTKVTPADLKKNEMLTIGVFTEVQAGDYVDWIPVIYGVEIPEWATWTESINAGLVSYYKCDDNLATTKVIDSLGINNGTATTNTANLYYASGLIGSAFDFDYSNSESIDFGTPLFPTNGDNFTFSIWVDFDIVGSTDLTVLSQYTGGAGGRTLFLFYDYSVGDISFYNIDAGLHSLGISTTSGLTHFAGRYDGTTLEYFIDGVSVKNITSLGNLENSNTLLGTNGDSTKYFDGIADELGIWDRALTNDEIVNILYNGGSGNTYTNAFGTAPSVTLTSPTNTANLTSATVEHIATVTDDIYVQNVTLYLDGVANETKSTHVNGSYTFTKVVSEGVHTWSILAYDNQSLSNQSANWTYNYTIPPLAIDLLSPSDASTHETPTVNVSCESYDAAGVLGLNLTINGVVNKTVTNSTPGENLTIQGDINFAEGNYTWGCSAYNALASAVSSNRTFEVLYSNPVITLILPSNNSGLTTQNVNFTFNATDLNGIDNVSLYINGVLNETNSSGINGSYSFNKIIADGNHNWSVISKSIYGKSTTSATRIFSVDSSAPSITLTAPPLVFDYLINGETLNLNWTVSDPNLDSCWYVYGDTYCYQESANIPDQTGIDGDCGLNYSGVYSGTSLDTLQIDGDWNTRITVSYGGGTSNVNYTKPYNAISAEWIVKDSSIQTTTIIDECMSQDIIQIRAAFGSGVYQCNNGTDWVFLQSAPFGSWNFYEDAINWTIYNPINCSLNTTTFDYTTNVNSVVFYANDTNGNIANETRTWSSLIGTFSIAYENPVYEGYENTITATIEGLAEGSALTEATLYYNGTKYSTSINYDGTDYEVAATLAAPAVTADTNYTFGFYLTIDGSVYDPQSNNQTVLNANFGECGGVSNDTILTMNLVDEDTQASILGDIEVGGVIKSVSSEETIGTIYTNFTNVTNATLCFSPPSAYDEYYMDAEIRYTSDGYSSELYYLQNADITDDLGNLTLYDLNESKSTRFKVTYQDSTYNFVDDAIVQLQRRYISEGVYKTVEAPLTSNEGVSILHINLDSIGYRATVVKDGVVLDTFDNLVFNCQSELTGECEHKLLGEIDPDNEADLDDTRDFSYSEPVLSNGTITVTFSIPSGSPSSVNIVLEQKDQFANTTLCNRTIVSSAGSMSCNYSEVLGESYIDFRIIKDGDPIAMKSYVVRASDYLDWLGNNYIFIFVLLLSLVGMALTSPEWMVINGIITMVISGGLYLARGLDFVVGLGAIVWLVISAIILISKMGKQEDR